MKDTKSEWQANNEGFTFGNTSDYHAKKASEYKPVYKKSKVTVSKLIKWVLFFVMLEVVRVYLIG